MQYEDDSAFTDYYETLEMAEDATTAEIEAALNTYQESMTRQLNNPLMMRSANEALKKISAIREHLLSGAEKRRAYDEERVRVKRRQALREEQDELPDAEGLDLRIKQPFFFDQYSGFDTEPITNTLRGIARKLDEEWPQARVWISDRSSLIHPIVGYLIHAALRLRLAERIGQIIQAIRQTDQMPMDTNEGIERCITIFNPNVQRPEVAIEGSHFDGSVLNTGSFLPDRPAQSEFTLYHNGLRGCAFGTIESRTGWMKFQGGVSSLRFALMPEGTPPEIGLSEVKIPLYFQINQLVHNAEYKAELLVRMENWELPVEKVFPVIIHIAALPPRIWFEPVATAEKPLQVRTVRRGEPISVEVTARNGGDERYIPLVAKISTNDNAASARPEKFHANQSIILTIDTKNRAYGSPYDVVYNVDYRQVPGAEGPATIHVHGELFPTVLQSMYRAKTMGSRLLTGVLLGVIGLVFLGGLGDLLAINFQSSWFLLLLIPLLLLWITHLGIRPIITHIQCSGRPEVEKKKVSAYVLWGLPLGIGLLLALLCGLVHNMITAFVLGGIVGTLVGVVLGFVLDTSAAGEARL